MDKMQQFRTEPSPALALLRDWMTTDQATLGELVKTLSDMGRDDVLTDMEEGTSASDFVRRYRARFQSGSVKSTGIAGTHGCKRILDSVKSRVDYRHSRKLSVVRRVSRSLKHSESGVTSRRHAARNKDKSVKVIPQTAIVHSSSTGAQRQDTSTQERNVPLGEKSQRQGLTDNGSLLSSFSSQTSAYETVLGFGSDTELSISDRVDDRFESQPDEVTIFKGDAMSSVRDSLANTGPKHSTGSLNGFNPIQKPLTLQNNPAQTFPDVGVKAIPKSLGDVEQARDEIDEVIGAPVLTQSRVDSAFFKTKRQFIDEVEQNFHSQHIQPQDALEPKTESGGSCIGVSGIRLPRLGTFPSCSFIDIRKGTRSASVNGHTTQYIHSPSMDLTRGPSTFENANLTEVKNLSPLQPVDNVDTVPKEAYLPGQMSQKLGPQPSQASMFFNSESSTVVTNMETNQTNPMNQRTSVCTQPRSCRSIPSASTEGFWSEMVTAKPQIKVIENRRPSSVTPRSDPLDTGAECSTVTMENTRSSVSSRPDTDSFCDVSDADGDTDAEPSVIPNTSQAMLRPCDRDLPEERVQSLDFPIVQRFQDSDEVVCDSHTTRNGILAMGVTVAGFLAIKVLQHI